MIESFLARMIWWCDPQCEGNFLFKKIWGNISANNNATQFIAQLLKITFNRYQTSARYAVFLLFLVYSINSYAQLSGSVTGTTDYIWRGYSKSDGKPAFQANIDYTFSKGLYVGAYGSTVNFADQGYQDRSNLEFIPYAGYAYKLSNDWRFNAEWARYIYDGKIFGQVVDYNLFYFYTHFRDLLTANVNFSENSYQQNHMSYSFEVTGRYPISNALELSTLLGYNNQKKVLTYDYLYWNAGMTLHFSRNIGADARYFGGIETAHQQLNIAPHWGFEPHVVDHRIVFSLTFGF